MLLCGACFSQNPGYMGNHVIFNAEGLISPSWMKKILCLPSWTKMFKADILADT